MDRQTKEKLRDELAEMFSKANAAVVAEYRGMTVEQMTKLRVELRKTKATLKILKNRIAKRAIQDHVPDSAPLSPALKGPIGVICIYGDSAQTTKAILDFEKENPNFVVKSGLLDGQAVQVNELKAIADLPSKEVLLARIIGSLVSPHRGLLGVLSAVPREVVQVINAIKEKKS